MSVMLLPLAAEPAATTPAPDPGSLPEELATVGCINPSCSAVGSAGERLVLVKEPSQPIAPDDLFDRAHRPGEVPRREGGP
jgi:hypothetical protein